ncbi:MULTISPECIES: hypothetical protein [Planktothricoides]|uniref:Uncharacterized protein n=2 Tax=Planktothricoides raciborskii TaxID=132608 RepID=A0AAU8JCH2_9CYAN|nr:MULTISPECIES: hypothetical protein [Planktothricoides]MBD2544628.1 hypothetical protein [Planktothricoides raciborskii FACHB-1370]MBD2583573.1 hypothetical protein [Planktothricoides raciborskii FACHB-1261]
MAIKFGFGATVPFLNRHQKSEKQNARELPQFAMTADESQNSRDRAIHYLGNLITGQ